MWRYVRIFMFILFIVATSLNTGIAAAPSWENPTGMQYSMTIYAKAKLSDGKFVEADGSMLAAFKDGECRGVCEIYSASAGKEFILNVRSDVTPESGLTLKVYNAETDQMCNIVEQFQFANNSEIGLIDTPVTYTANCSQPVLSVTPVSQSVSNQMGTAIFTVKNTGTGVMNWTATPTESWLTILSGASGTGNGTILVMYNENNSSPRTGTITVTATGANNSPQTLNIIQSSPMTLTIGKVAGKTDALVSVDITVEGIDVDLANIAGAVFTLEYDAGVVLKKIESKFFDTFEAQFDTANQTLPSVEANQPLFHNSQEGTEKVKTLVSAARGIITPDAEAAGNVLFTLTFGLKDINNPVSSDINILPTVLDSSDAGYDDLNGRTSNVLIGYDEISDTFSVLMDDTVNENGYSTHVEPGSVGFGDCVIIASAGLGGSISPSGSVVTDCGSDKEFTITPDPCYEIEELLVDNVSLGSSHNAYIFSNITETHEIKATFKVKTYKVTVNANAGGSVSYEDDSGNIFSLNDSGEIPIDCGKDITLLMTTEYCYQIANMSDNNTAVQIESLEKVGENKIAYPLSNISTDRTIDIQFAPVENLTITASGSMEGLGTIQPSGDISVACGASQTFLITLEDDECYYIEDVLVNGVSEGAITSRTFTNITANQTIEALFGTKNYTFEIISGEGGTISPPPDEEGKVAVACKSTPTITIEPDDCHTIDYIYVDGVLMGTTNTHTFPPVTKDYSIEAAFKIKTFNIIVSAVEGGNILSEDKIVSGAVEVDCATDKTFDFKAHTGYHIVEVIIDGMSQGAISNYTFTDITEAHTVQAKFETNLPGDINGDKVVNLADAIMGLKIISKIEAISNINIGADVDEDEKIGIKEVIYILRHVVGSI